MSEVLVAVPGLSLVAAGGGCSPVVGRRLLPAVAPLLWSVSSRALGLQ